MNYIYILFFTELLFICLSLWITRNNFLSPSFVSYVMFTLGTLCVIYNIEFWNVLYSYKAYIITCLGFVVMLLPELFFKHKNFKQECDEKEYKTIKIDINVNMFIIMLCCIFTMLFVRETIIHGKSVGASGLYVIGAAKYDIAEGMNFISKIALRFTQIMFYFYCYVLLYNTIKCKERIAHQKAFFIPLICYLVVTFISGNRLGLVKIIVAVYSMILVMNYQITGGKNHNIKSTIKKVIVTGMILLSVFYGMRTISKVGSTTQNRTFVEYITYYVGSPIYLFSKYVDNPRDIHGINNYWGEQCFTGMYDSFNISVNGGNNFVKIGGKSNFAGNAFTWFQRPINDFGIIGMMVFTFGIYYLFSFLLYRCVLKASLKWNNYSLIVFSFFYFVIVMSFYYCQTCWAVTLWNIIIVISICLSLGFIPRLRVGGKK